MKATRRTALSMATALAAGTLGAACTGGASGSTDRPARNLADLTGTVQFWHRYNPTTAGGDWLVKAKQLFLQKAPKLQIDDTFVTGVFQEKVTTAAVAGNPPDVTFGDMFSVPTRGASGENRAIDSYLSRDKLKLDDLIDYQAKRVLYTSKPYGLPYHPDTRILYFNKSLLSAAGLDPGKPPVTWDDISTQAERLTKQTSPFDYTQLGFYPAAPPGGLGNVWFWTIAWTNGADFADAKNVPTLNTKPNQETLDWLVKWAQKYNHAAVVKWAADLNAGGSSAFFQGKLAYQINTNGYASNIKQSAPSLSWGVSLNPYKVKKASWGAGFDLEMPAGGKNSDGGWAWTRWLGYDPESNRLRIKMTDALVALKAANLSPEFASDPVWKVTIESLAVTNERPQILEVLDWWATLDKHVQAAYAGTEGVKEALDKAQSEVMAQFEQYKKR